MLERLSQNATRDEFMRLNEPVLNNICVESLSTFLHMIKFYCASLVAVVLYVLAISGDFLIHS